MPRRISTNVIGVADRSAYLAMMRRLNPNGALLMDVELAIALYDMNPQGTWVIRFWAREDGDWWHTHSARETIEHLDAVVKSLENQYQRPMRQQFWFYPWLNEASTGNEHPLSALLQWYQEFMAEAKKHNLRVTSCGIATAKTIQEADIQAGKWDNVLRDAKAHKEHFLWDFHSYQEQVAPRDYLGIGSLYDNIDRTKAAMRLENWPKINLQTEVPTIQGQYIGRNYHHGRELALEKRSVELGLGRFPYVITESVIDRAGDLPDHKRAKEDSKFQTPPYDAMRGPFGHRQFWAWLDGLTAISDDRFLDYWVRHYFFLEEGLPQDCLFIAGFACTEPDKGWDTPEGDNHWDRNYRDRFWNKIIARYEAREGTTPPHIEPPKEPPMTLIDAMLYSTDDFTRIRAAATTNSAELGKITKVGVRGLIQSDYKTKDWPYLEVGNIKGYSLKLYLRIEPIVVTPPPDENETIYELNILEGTVRGTAQEFDKLATLVETLARAFREAKEVE